MGEGLSTIFCFLFGLAALAHATRSLVHLDAAATMVRASWQQEYLLRQCGGNAAAEANLAAASQLIGKRLPHLRELVARTEAEIMAKLWASTPNQADVRGRCHQAGPWPAQTELHQQQHQRQKEPWPNWVLRFTPTKADRTVWDRL